MLSDMFLALWGFDAKEDAWRGYPAEKQRLLEAFHSVPNVIVLSGDRHEFAHIEFNGPGLLDTKVHEISTSPMSMFWIPFVRTLELRSEETVTRIETKLNETEDGELLPITQVDEVPKESILK